MGLDMYLYAEQYTSRYDFMKRSGESGEYDKADAILRAAGLEEFQVEDAGVRVSATAMYWRKANQIHNWFVTNVQGGVDDCGRYYVSREQLEQLRDLCVAVERDCFLVPDMVTNGHVFHPGDADWQPVLEPGEVILNPECAEELLPTVGGFFFGSTDYDQYYMEDIRDTIKGLNRILALPDNVTFYYQSSW